MFSRYTDAKGLLTKFEGLRAMRISKINAWMEGIILNVKNKQEELIRSCNEGYDSTLYQVTQCLQNIEYLKSDIRFKMQDVGDLTKSPSSPDLLVSEVSIKQQLLEIEMFLKSLEKHAREVVVVDKGKKLDFDSIMSIKVNKITNLELLALEGVEKLVGNHRFCRSYVCNGALGISEV